MSLLVKAENENHIKHIFCQWPQDKTLGQKNISLKQRVLRNDDTTFNVSNQGSVITSLYGLDKCAMYWNVTSQHQYSCQYYHQCQYQCPVLKSPFCHASWCCSHLRGHNGGVCVGGTNVQYISSNCFQMGPWLWFIAWMMANCTKKTWTPWILLRCWGWGCVCVCIKQNCENIPVGGQQLIIGHHFILSCAKVGPH